MFRRLHILAGLLLIAATPVGLRAVADEKPPSLAEAKARDEAQTIADAAGKPVINARSVFDIIKMTLRNKDLFVDTKLSPTDESIVRAPGLAGLSKVRITTLVGANAINVAPLPPGGPAPILQYSFENIDYSSPQAISIHTSVSQVPGQLMLSQDWDQLSDETHTVQLIQSTRQMGEGENRVTLYVQITGSPPVDLRLGAQNIVELRRQYPGETARYVDPIFRTLRQEGLLARVDPKLAWQVFSFAFTPSSDLDSRLKNILPRLDAPSYPERQAASAELEQLGQPAALLLMREDRKNLSDEQRTRIDAFIAKYKIVNDAEAKRLRGDRDFLLDCLYSDDAVIRREALTELRKVTGQAIKFNENAPPEQRLETIARLRQSLGATPATQEKK
jgi:hypothetical protein